MRYADIKKFDINNGPGVRVSLWVTGCEFRCVGCHNKSIQNRNEGELFTEATLERLFELMDEDIPKELSILGGEPLTPYNRKDVINVCRRVKEKFPERKIWLWTGYSFGYIKKAIPELLKYVDVIVDGLFVEELYDENLMYRGSSNQRIVYVNGAYNEER